MLNGRFVLAQRLGEGGMGTVYKALDLRKQEAQDRTPFVALKVLSEDFRRHPEALKSLQRETKKAQTLAHPNVITVHDFDRDGATIYMTMEYLPGQSLDRIVRAKDFKGMPKHRRPSRSCAISAPRSSTRTRTTSSISTSSRPTSSSRRTGGPR